MEKNLLIFVSILLLNSAPSYADNESGLPALPPIASEVQEEGEAGSDSSKSLWQKFKEYVGFGSIKKTAEKQSDVPLVVKKIEDTGQTAQSKSMNDEQIVVENKENNISSDSIPPIGSTDEGPMNVKLPEKSEGEVEVPDQLKLPDGFGEDVIKDSNSSISSNEPTQDATNLDEITHKNNAPAASKILDQVEDKTKAVKEAAEPKTEELSIPQLPEADENKAKEVIKNDDVKETIEPKKEEEPVPAVKDESIVKLALPTDKPVDESANSPSITVPEYANAANQPNEDEAAISKYKKEFEAKSSKSVVIPKISESELSLENKSKQVELKASDLEEFDADQLKFVNNEAQVLILPNDDIVLGVLDDEAKLDQMDFRSYIDRFWENYNKLKREPKRLEIERFIDNYDELFDNNSPYEEK